MSKNSYSLLFVTDIDGTVLNSANSISKAIVDTIFHFSSVVINYEYFLPYIGTPIREVLISHLPNIEVEEAVIFFRERLIEIGNHESSLMPCVEKVLRVFREKGVAVCAATNKHVSLAEIVLKQQGVRDYFHAIYGSDLYAAKPSGEMICVAKREFPALQSFMLGDRPEDMQAAHAAGVKSIYLSNEYDYLLSKLSIIPDYVIADWTDIFDIKEIREVIQI
jgi:phosphoglycolate phosphatase